MGLVSCLFFKTRGNDDVVRALNYCHNDNQVASIYNSFMIMRERICSNEIKEFTRWDKILDSCLDEVLSVMEKWFVNHTDTILGDVIEGTEGEPPPRTPIMILDLEIQCVTWESMPFLRGEDVYRMPSLISVLSTLQRSRCFMKEDGGLPVIDLSKTYYVLNPAKDLKDTQANNVSILVVIGNFVRA